MNWKTIRLSKLVGDKTSTIITYTLAITSLSVGLLLPSKEVEVEPDGITHGREIEMPPPTHTPYLTYIQEQSEITCMALTVWGEARGAVYKEQLAYASVIYNRYKDSRLSKMYSDSVCDVVLAPHQFEPVNKNKSLKRLILKSQSGEYWVTPSLNTPANKKKYAKIREMSALLLSGKLKPNTKANHVWSPKAQTALNRQQPFWKDYLKPLRQIGVSEFYIDYERTQSGIRYFTKEKPYINREVHHGTTTPAHRPETNPI